MAGYARVKKIHYNTMKFKSRVWFSLHGVIQQLFQLNNINFRLSVVIL